MKRINLIITILFLLFVSCSNEDNTLIDSVPDIVEEIENEFASKEVNIYIAKAPIKGNTKIKALWEEITSPEEDSWFIFVDEHPFANWSHPCKYFFISTETGEKKVFEMQTPPDIIDEMTATKKVSIDENGKLFDFSNIPPLPETRSTDISNKWAVIINGGGNASSNYIRYWNDCAAIYSTLIKRYGYKKSNIELLIADGNDPAPDRRLNNGTYDSSPLDLDGDGVVDLQYAATSNNIANTFNKLANQLTPNDELFIFVTDHGTRIGNSSVIVLWGGSYLDESTLSSYLSRINTKNINIVMGQCNSGGFINLAANNRIIATACKDTELSYARTDLLYDEFLYHWISAANGKTPNGQYIHADYNNDGKVSMEEAFIYAQTADIKNETPQYSSTPVSLGKQLSFSKILSPAYLNRGSKFQFKLDGGQSATWSIEKFPGTLLTIDTATGLFTNHYPTFTGSGLIKAVSGGKTYYKYIDIAGEFLTGHIENYNGSNNYPLPVMGYGMGLRSTDYFTIQLTDPQNIHSSSPSWRFVTNNGSLRMQGSSNRTTIRVDPGGRGSIAVEVPTKNGTIEQLYYIN